MQTDERLFTVRPAAPRNLKQKAAAVAAPMLDRAFQFHRITQIYNQIRDPSHLRGGIDFCRALIDKLDVRIEVSSGDVARVPRSGPVIVVSNHPFGLLDPMILYTVLGSVRPDVKVVANSILSRAPELDSFCIYVDPFGSKEARRGNSHALRQAMQHLTAGGMVVVFPAGEVAALDARRLKVVEPQWNAAVSRMIERVPASVLPVFFKGTNKPGFHVSGLIHPRLRTALLPRELLNKQHSTIHLAIGHPIPRTRLESHPSHRERTDYLRTRVFHLRTRWYADRPGKSVGSRSRVELEPVAPAAHPEVLAAEISRLPAEALLLRSGRMAVYCVAADQIPEVLREIGRQRELTFREAGEGTGRPLDLDRFDPYYLHLFAWNHQSDDLVGAYRIGRADQIVARQGPGGLYTQTLFRLHPRLLSQINPALELGRSFVALEYQRMRLALALLWKGLARVVLRYPQYTRLFGPVSISSEYHTVSHRMMIRFLKQYHFLHEQARLVSARVGHPLADNRFRRFTRAALQSNRIEDLSDMISDLEWDGKGIPVLIREYLKLGGRVLDFNVDKDFNNVIDALILVDLLQTNRRVLEWYMGKDGAASLLALHHRETPIDNVAA